MSRKERIYQLYFNEKKTLTEIAEDIKTSISYVSKVLRSDNRYILEKEKRKQDTKDKRRKIQKEMIYRKRKQDTSYIDMKNMHNQASKELSKHSIMGNQALRKWASSAYIYNKKKNRYEFDTKNLTKPADYPLYIRN